MILFINTSQTDLTQLKLIEKNKVINRLESREEFKQSELLLKMIDKLISAKGACPPVPRLGRRGPASGWKSIKSIVVVAGPGAFSALRLGIATANTLAWALKIPIVKVSANQISDEKELLFTIKEIINRSHLDAARAKKDKKIKNFKPVVPRYGKEPNITIKKD